MSRTASQHGPGCPGIKAANSIIQTGQTGFLWPSHYSAPNDKRQENVTWLLLHEIEEGTSSSMETDRSLSKDQLISKGKRQLHICSLWVILGRVSQMPRKNISVGSFFKNSIFPAVLMLFLIHSSHCLTFIEHLLHAGIFLLMDAFKHLLIMDSSIERLLNKLFNVRTLARCWARREQGHHSLLGEGQGA